ncbi:MAG: hypothetical protein QXG22_03230 [Candidatus Hadarchaeales archaeon]
MGVYHLSGMGLRPGVVTVPLTYIYLFLKSAVLGNENAKRFFETSGELKQGSRGAPECIIIFTSRSVITGTAKIEIEDKWFGSGRVFPQSMWKYLRNLWKELEDEKFRPFYDGEWIKDIYFVEVNHEDFEDCFEKIGTTLYALREKEVWINMIGGTNPINMALLLGGTFHAISARYYYIFQNDVLLLHPETERPNMRDPREYVENAMRKWREFPLFQLAIGELINELNSRLAKGDMGMGELEQMLERLDLPKQFIAKLRGRLITIEGDRVSRGPFLESIANLGNKIHKEVKNFSKWKRWATELNILWEMKDGKLIKVSPRSLGL